MSINPLRALTMRHLQCFTLLVEERHFGRAAERLGITQPALSNAIKQLERIVGAQLLRRSTHQLDVTEAGLQLLERAQYLVHTFDTTLADMDSVLRSGRARIRVGTMPSASTLMASCMQGFQREVSGTVEFSLEDGLSDELVARTRTGQLDVTLTAVLEPPTGLVNVPLLEDPVVLVTRRDHVLAAHAEVNWRQVSGQRLVVFAAGSMPALGDVVLAQFGHAGPNEKAGAPAEEPFRVHHLETLYSMVRSGLGVGLLPQLYTTTLRDPALAVIQLRRPRLHRTVSLLYRSGVMRNAQVGQFIAYLEAQLPHLPHLPQLQHMPGN
ncbi:LysR family transcriptional regulator [Variovorax sp. HJSM1_2]|uniref:LysR family transcriptional regulator n=1 Tax=Variovorax sp. HJSM1_2 TaxID=3366263 RepID=UPI003BEDF7A9